MMKRLFLFFAVMLAAAATPVFAQNSNNGNNGNNSDNPVVVMHTNMGDITMEVFDDKAPKTAANFLQYVKDDFYAGTIFHRVIPGFVIQGGGFTAEYEPAEGVREPIENESDNALKNKRGTVAMARTRAPDSATSQFFINLRDNPSLNYHKGQPGYTVFAKVVDGMHVVMEIASVPTGSAGPFRQNVPQKTVMIQSAEIVSAQ